MRMREGEREHERVGERHDRLRETWTNMTDRGGRRHGMNVKKETWEQKGETRRAHKHSLMDK